MTEDEEVDEEDTSSITLETAVETAFAEITEYLNSMPPYDFQKLVAGLLRGMGYHASGTPRPAPTAASTSSRSATDLGRRTLASRCRSSASRPARPMLQACGRSCRSSTAAMSASSASLGGFTSSATAEARNSETRRITLVDTSDLFDLWVSHYAEIPERARRLLPLKPVYYLDRRDLGDEPAHHSGCASSADLLCQLDDDPLRAADVAESIAVFVALHLANELHAAGSQASDDGVDPMQQDGAVAEHQVRVVARVVALQIAPVPGIDVVDVKLASSAALSFATGRDGGGRSLARISGQGSSQIHPRRRSAARHREELRLQVFSIPSRPPSRPRPECFNAAERRVLRSRRRRWLTAYHAYLQRPPTSQRTTQVGARTRRPASPHLAVVRERDRSPRRRRRRAPARPARRSPRARCARPTATARSTVGR